MEELEQDNHTLLMTGRPVLDGAPRTGSENCLPVGSRLAEFEITGIVGEGGFGVVYRGFDHSLQRNVAIKEYMPGALAGRGADKSVVVRSERHQETFEIGLKSFINEARLLAQFDHPALVKVYRFWEQNKTGYMAMRFYEGETLKVITKRNPSLVTEAWLKSMLKPILEALNALYSFQILHRDISPDNIMIQKNGEAVLLDFGAARQIIGDMTQALTVILKPGYAPIEQYANDTTMKQGPWTDIYALSAVVYSLIIKKPPATSVARIIKDPLPLLHIGGVPGYSREFLAAIDKGLAVKPEDRPQSIQEFRTLLGIDAVAAINTAQPGATVTLISDRRKTPRITPLAEGASVPTGPLETSQVAEPESLPQIFEPSQSDPLPEAMQPSEKMSPKRTWRIVAVLCVLLVVIAVGGFVFLDRSEDPVLAASARIAMEAGKESAGVPVPTIEPSKINVAASTIPVNQEEKLAWEAIKDSRNLQPQTLSEYIHKYPSGAYTDLAKEKLEKFRATEIKIASEVMAKDPSGGNSPALTGLASSQQAQNAGAATGTVLLEIKPWGTVFVDGISKGASPPLKKLSLPEGKHQVKVINPNFAEYVTEIEVTKDKSGSIVYDFSPIQKVRKK